MTATKQQLIETRRQLGKYMIVLVGGFEYEAVFGINEEVGESAHVSVHVNLTPTNFYDYNATEAEEISAPSENFYSFKVEIKFYPLTTSNLRDAEEFRRSVKNAMNKAIWAQGLVRGLVWDWKTIKELGGS